MSIIGYWHNDHHPLLPHPQSLVDPDWEPDRRVEIVAYLRAGKVSCFFAGYSYCRFQCGGAGLGSRELTDGTWAWPEGLVHYVEVHKIKLPDEFIAHAAKREFQIKELFDAMPGPMPGGPFGFWENWCRKHGEFKPESGCYTCSPTMKTKRQ